MLVGVGVRGEEVVVIVVGVPVRVLGVVDDGIVEMMARSAHRAGQRVSINADVMAVVLPCLSEVRGLPLTQGHRYISSRAGEG